MFSVTLALNIKTVHTQDKTGRNGGVNFTHRSKLRVARTSTATHFDGMRPRNRCHLWGFDSPTAIMSCIVANPGSEQPDCNVEPNWVKIFSLCKWKSHICFMVRCEPTVGTCDGTRSQQPCDRLSQRPDGSCGFEYWALLTLPSRAEENSHSSGFKGIQALRL